MALDADAMGTAMAAAFEAAAPAPGETQSSAERVEMWQGVAQAIIDELTSNGVIDSTGIGNLGSPVVSVGTIS